MEQELLTSPKKFSEAKEFGKNREKLLKLEIELQRKDYLKQKELNKPGNETAPTIPLKAQTSQYSKYQSVRSELDDNLVTKLITDNMVVNIFSKQRIYSWFNIPTKIDELNYYSKWWRFYDSSITMCNVFVMMLAIYDYELNFRYPRQIVNDYNTVRILMILLSLCAIFCVLKRYYNKQKWKNIRLVEGSVVHSYDLYKSKDDDDGDDFFYEEKSYQFARRTSFFKKGLFIDIIINLMIPYPRLDFIIKTLEIDRDINDYIQVEYLFSDLLYLLVVLRLFYLIRATINYSIFTDHFANSVAKDYGVKCNVRFALKCILKTQHFKIVIVFLLASIVIFGFALRIFERPFWASKNRLDFDYITNSMWLVFVTMMTIGYGDFAPVTAAGKYVLILSALWGTFITSLTVVCLFGLLDLSNDQFEVFIKIIKSRIAINFIENAYRLKKNRDMKKINKSAFTESYDDLISSFSEFRNMRKECKSVYRSNGLLFYNMKMLREMKKIHQRLDKVEVVIEGFTSAEHKSSEINVKKYN